MTAPVGRCDNVTTCDYVDPSTRSYSFNPPLSQFCYHQVHMSAYFDDLKAELAANPNLAKTVVAKKPALEQKAEPSVLDIFAQDLKKESSLHESAQQQEQQSKLASQAKAQDRLDRELDIQNVEKGAAQVAPRATASDIKLHNQAHQHINNPGAAAQPVVDGTGITAADQQMRINMMANGYRDPAAAQGYDAQTLKQEAQHSEVVEKDLAKSAERADEFSAAVDEAAQAQEQASAAPTPKPQPRVLSEKEQWRQQEAKLKAQHPEAQGFRSMGKEIAAKHEKAFKKVLKVVGEVAKDAAEEEFGAGNNSPFQTPKLTPKPGSEAAPAA